MLFFWKFLLRVGWERNGTAFFIFSISRPFPTYFVGTKRNDIFYFLYISTFSNLFWLGMKPQWYFFILLNFVIFFWNFLLPVRSEGNGKTIFIFSLSRHFPTYFVMKWSHNGIFLFFYFFTFFGILYFPSSTNGTERQFLFSPFLLIFQPILAWKEAIMG